MSEIKLLIIGSKSDLIQPLLEKVKDNNIYIFKVNRDEWDLASDLPSSEIIEKIINLTTLCLCIHNLFIFIRVKWSVCNRVGFRQIQTVYKIDHISSHCFQLLQSVLHLVSILFSTPSCFWAVIGDIFFWPINFWVVPIILSRFCVGFIVEAVNWLEVVILILLSL